MQIMICSKINCDIMSFMFHRFTHLYAGCEQSGSNIQRRHQGGLAEDSMIASIDLSFSLFRYLMIN